MPEIAIRPTCESDLPMLMLLDHGGQTQAVWQIERTQEVRRQGGVLCLLRLPRPVRLEYPRSVAELPQRWTGYLLMLTALFQDQPVAYVALRVRDDPAVLWVEELVTRSDVRRQGIATALLLACRSWALQNGRQVLALEISARNAPMMELAERLGYRFSGYREGYLPNQESAVFFFHVLK